jgi:hypothetical protein
MHIKDLDKRKRIGRMFLGMAVLTFLFYKAN